MNKLDNIEKQLRKRIKICLENETFREMSDEFQLSCFFRSLCSTGIIDDPKDYMIGIFDNPIVTDEESNDPEFNLLISTLFDECLEFDRSMRIDAKMHEALTINGWVWNLGTESQYAFNKETESRISGNITKRFLCETALEIIKNSKQNHNRADIESFLIKNDYAVESSSNLIAIDKKGNLFEGDCLVWLLKSLDFDFS
jgi:hypothetical protein